uniref:Uncharacterized protein n=1 Tax=Arundo donax TaxID=35708 RepID=A0A0A8YWC4_ARUDO
MEDIGGGRGVGYHVPLLVLSSEPVSDEEGGGSSGPAAGDSEVGVEERPESVKLFPTSRYCN